MLLLLLCSIALGGARDAVIGEIDALTDALKLARAEARLDDCRELGVRAEALARGLPRRNPYRSVTLHNLAICEFDLARYDEALAHYEAALDLRLKYVRTHGFDAVLRTMVSLGATHHARGDLTAARGVLEQAWTALVQHQYFPPERFELGLALGNVYEELGLYDEARTMYEWVLTSLLNERPPDDPMVAVAQVNLARLIASRGELQGARDLLERAVATADAVDPTSPATAWAHATLAWVLGDLGASDAARAHQEHAVALLVAALGPGHPETAVQRANLATWLSEDGDLAGADAALRAALADLEAAGGAGQPAAATMRVNLGQIARERGRYDEARAWLESAHADGEDALLARLAIAMLDGELGRYDASEQAHTEVIPELAALLGPTHPDVVQARFNLAALRQTRGDFAAADAELAALEALRTETLGAAHLEVGRLRNARGVLAFEEGRLADAERLLEEAVAIYEGARGPQHVDVSEPLTNLASLRALQGRAREAEALLRRALALRMAALGPEHPETAHTLNQLAQLALSRGDLEVARPLLEQALAVTEAALGPDHPGLCDTLSVLGALESEQGGDGRPRLERSLAIATAAFGPAHPHTAQAHVALATEALRWGDAETAAHHADVAVASYRSLYGEDNVWAASADLTRGDVDLARGDPEAAAVRFRRTLAAWTAQAGGHATSVGPTLVRLAQAESAAGRPDAAREAAAEALALLELSLSDLLGALSERERLELAASARVALDVALSLSEDPEEAWAAVLRWKGIATRSLVRAPPGDPRAVELAAVRQELAAAAWSGGDVRDLTARKEALQRSLGGDVLPVPTPVELARVLPAGTSLVDLVRWQPLDSAPAYDAFVLQGATLHRHRVGDVATIDAAVDRYRALLAARAPIGRVDRAGAEVRALVWDRLGVDGDAIVAPDGELAALSFAALPVDGGYLVERASVRVVDHPRSLLVAPSTGGVGALVVAATYGETDTDALADATRGGCVDDLPPLPGALAEARAVAERWGAELLAGDAATEAGVAGAMRGKRIVHLATHGFFASGACRAALPGEVGKSPMLLSGVALAGANRRDDGAGGDGLWTAEEIAALDLAGTELVVLSACETGLGEVATGEGVMGLRRAFVQAGVGATVTSLWPVDDAATRTLMEAFHAALAAGTPAPDALRAAQRALLDESRARYGEARPGTWAAFVLSGG